jgi:hypothetical protein
LSGGEKGDGNGWCGWEYFSGWISEKYRAISSGVGGGNRIRPDAPVAGWLPSDAIATERAAAEEIADACVEEAGSDRDVVGKKVAANGAEEYSSCRRVRPKAITGLVA